MKQFCHECGNPMEADQVFCAECGTPKAVPSTESPKPVVQKTKKPWSFKKKLSFMLIGFLAIALVAGHYTIQANTSPDSKISNFLTALQAGDSESVLKEISISEDIIKDEKVYVSYLKSLDYDVIEANITEGAAGIKEDGITRVITDDNGHQIFKLKQEKYLSLYPVVTIEAIPVNVELATDLPNGEYSIAGKTFDLAKGNQVMGAFLPGIYSTTAKAEGAYQSSAETEQEITGNEDLSIEFQKQQLMVTLASDEPESIVFINGKTTEKKVKDLGEVGPVFEGDTVSLHAELKDQKSDPVDAVGGEQVNLSVGEEAVAVVEEKENEEEVEETAYFDDESINDFIWDFRYAYESALNSKSYSEVASYLQPGSTALKEIDEFIGDLGDQYFLYQFYTDDVLDYTVDGKTAYVTTYEEFDFTNHLYETINYKRNKVYEIVVGKDDMYEIVSIEILDTQRTN